jgi:hypothetical protein
MMPRTFLAAFAFTVSASASGPPPVYARLLDPIASYSTPGTPWRAVVTGSASPTRPSPIPSGSILSGRVVRAQPLGLGLRRERAILELAFDACLNPSGAPFPCAAELQNVDNARERISANRVQGILPAGHPHSYLNGFWLRPRALLFPKSAAGLVGAGGALHARVIPHPAAGVLIAGVRILFLRLPNGEVELPAGADLIVRVHAGTEHPFPQPAPIAPPIAPPIAGPLASLSPDVHHANGQRAADLINLAFFGSRQALETAFLAAGWFPAAPLTPRTFARTYAAYAAMKPFPTAPVSPLLYEGQLPAIVFQKSLNTLAKRHHIRIWPHPGQPDIWLGSATHDVGVGLEPARKTITHKIDRHIDRERLKVLTDLQFAGCIESHAPVERPLLASPPSPKARIVTDGALFAVTLRPCSIPDSHPPVLHRPAHPFAASAFRRVVLETRHYLVRGNPYFLAFRSAHWAATPKRRAAELD